jgi:hypothetical protein
MGRMAQPRIALPGGDPMGQMSQPRIALTGKTPWPNLASL